ncbi:MAG: CHAT domain-containing protein [Candidatus Hodarchaeota archaeon]
MQVTFVFLNACRTGERQVHLLEETLSLSSGILAFGERAVAGTLWPIQDEVACSFANKFYNVLLKQKTIGEAYQHAMASLIDKSSHSAFWSPYILIGNPKLSLFPD